MLEVFLTGFGLGTVFGLLLAAGLTGVVVRFRRVRRGEAMIVALSMLATGFVIGFCLALLWVELVTALHNYGGSGPILMYRERPGGPPVYPATEAVSAAAQGGSKAPRPGEGAPARATGGSARERED